MPANQQILNDLDSQLLKDIRKLASGNMAPNQIAAKLGINKAGFLRIWRDKGSNIREAYEAGRADIKALKAKKLRKEIKGGNVTAIQIDNNLAQESEFEAKKKEIFELE